MARRNLLPSVTLRNQDAPADELRDVSDDQTDNKVMIEPPTNKKEGWMKYAIHWLLHDAEIPEEENGTEETNDPVELIEAGFPLSRTLFPSIVRVYKVGSRAEKTNIFAASDTDNIFEVGPGTIVRNNTEKESLFKYKNTDHVGFYQIVDERGDYLYPQLFQIKAGSILHSQKDLLYKTGEISAAITKDGEDQVLSLRLDKWPCEIIKSLDGKLEWLGTPLTYVTDFPLFFVPKSHVDSVNKNLEWRLSFSVVEKEIIKKIPPIPRRAFMICKELMSFMIFKSSSNDFFPRELWKVFFLRDKNDFLQENLLLSFFLEDKDKTYQDKFWNSVRFRDEGIINEAEKISKMIKNKAERISKMIKDKYNPLTTYHWKTALLKIMDETWGKAERSIGDLYDMVRELIEFVLQAVEEESMCNYFLPDMNLYHKFTDEELKSCKDLLEEMLNDFPETIKTLVFSKNYNVNFRGENKRYHLLPYQRFDEFHQEIKDFPNVLLLEGYYTFLTSMFTCDLKNPSGWFMDTKDSCRLEHSTKHAYFLKRMVQHLGLCEEDGQQFLHNLNDGFKSFTADFPFTKLLVNNAKLDDSHIEVLKIDLAVANSNKKTPSCILEIAIRLCGNSQQTKLKVNVNKYINKYGQIIIAELKNDIQQHFVDKMYHECCEKVVKHLSYNFKQDEPELIKWLQPENVKECMGFEKPDLENTGANPPILEDIKCTAFDLLWKILEPVLKAENEQWMNIAKNMRNSLLNSIREQSDE